jgi:hypothetical protein
MSKSKLEIYKENFTKLIDAFADMHNSHCKFLKRPTKVQRIKLRSDTMKVKKIVGAIQIDISQVYHENVSNRNARRVDRIKKQGTKDISMPHNQYNGEQDVKKDI